MRMRDVRKGLRVRLSAKARARLTLPDDVSAELGRSMLIPRQFGTVRSPRPIATRPPYEEGLVVYVVWDGLPTPERWHLTDLDILPNNSLSTGAAS